MKHAPIIPGGTICILGAGQLGKMSLQAAHQLGYHTMVWAPDGDIPAMEMATYRLVSPYNCPNTINRVLETADVITTEWENIPIKLVAELERRNGLVRPGSNVLRIAQSRIAEKRMAWTLGIPTTPTIWLPQNETWPTNWQSHLPGILKINASGYDGKGQWSVSTTDELRTALAKANVDCVLERRVDLLCELSVLVARTADGRIGISDAVQNRHRNGILDTTTFPVIVDDVPLAKRCEEDMHNIAKKVSVHLNLKGMLCLEFFVDKSHKIFLNEIAPRPHNSFHGSIEAARTSQFEQHIRAICGLPLGEVRFHTEFTMRNLIGGNWAHDWSTVLNDSSARLHLYGKAESRPGRKMGHVTYLK